MTTALDQEQAARINLASLYSIIPVSFAVIGMQLFMCSYGLIVFKETPTSLRKGRLPYVICSWLILLLFATSEIGDAVEHFLVSVDSKSPIDALQVVRPKLESTWWRVVTSACLWLGNWIGDGMLVWRCFHVWFEYRWVAYIPALIYCGSCVTSILALTYRVLWQLDPTRGPQMYGKTIQAWIFLSVAVNVIVTALISFRLLQMRKELRPVLSREDLQVYLGIIAILVESALPLSVVGILYASVAPPSSSGASTAKMVARTTILMIWWCLNAMCPQMIIFRVLTGKSWLTKPTSNGPQGTTGRVEMSTEMDFTDPTVSRSIRDDEEDLDSRSKEKVV